MKKNIFPIFPNRFNGISSEKIVLCNGLIIYSLKHSFVSAKIAIRWGKGGIPNSRTDGGQENNGMEKQHVLLLTVSTFSSWLHFTCCTGLDRHLKPMA